MFVFHIFVLEPNETSTNMQMLHIQDSFALQFTFTLNNSTSKAAALFFQVCCQFLEGACI